MKKCTQIVLLSFCFMVLVLYRAEAAVIYTDVSPDIVSTSATWANPAYQIDMNGDGSNDIGIGVQPAMPPFTPITYRIRRLHTGLTFSCITTSNVNTDKKDFTETIGPASTWYTFNSTLDFLIAAGGGWASGVDGYVGVRFGTSPNFYYGWMRIQFNTGAGSLTLYEYAYQNTVNTSITAGQMAPLPVEIISFDARLQGNTAHLDWTTASELNNQGFQVERMTADDGQWAKIGFVPGHGSAIGTQSYTYTDDRPLPGTNYYRLRQMDFDGNFENSPIVSVAMKQESGIHLFPNPAAGAVTLALETDHIGEARLTFYDLTGRQIRTQVLLIENSILHTKIDLSGLQSGMYLATVTLGNEQWQTKLMVD